MNEYNAYEVVLEETAKAESSTVSIFNQHITNATILKNRYQILEQTGVQTTEFLIRQRQLGNISTSLSSTIKNYQKSKEHSNITVWLNDVKEWSVSAYKEITSFRTFITGGQRLVYDVMNSTGSFVYRMGEEDFIKLLSNKGLKVDWHQNFDKIEGNLTSVLQLHVDNPTTSKLSEDISRTVLRKDPLYNYIRNKVPNMQRSRLLELYSQVKSDYEGKELDKSTKISISNFINRYNQTKDLASDNITFYRTGDAIQDNMTLIENKVGGSASVSIRTIKNAIQDIANLGIITSANELKDKLKAMFTYVGQESLAKKIQEGVAETARKAINELVDSLQINGYFK